MLQIYIHQQKNAVLVPEAVPLPPATSNICISLTPTGYPILPTVDFADLKKLELENLMHAYLNQHYTMCLIYYNLCPDWHRACIWQQCPACTICQPGEQYIKIHIFGLLANIIHHQRSLESKETGHYFLIRLY